MFRSRTERRLDRVTTRLRRAREELQVIEEQLLQQADEADDARLRALVSEHAEDARAGRESARHADAAARTRDHLTSEIARLEREQDELLDQLVPGSR